MVNKALTSHRVVVVAAIIVLTLTRQSGLGADTAGDGQASTDSFGQWLRQADRLSGDWGGVRTKMADHGFRFSLYWNQYWGYEERGRYSGSVDLFGQVDFGKAGWIPGGEVLIHLKNTHGLNVNQDVGAWGQPIDDADGRHNLYIPQFWYQQTTPNQTFQLRLGYVDLQSILDRNAYANAEDKQFVNTYLDNNNATIPLKIGPAVSLVYNATDWLSMVAAVSEGDSKLYRSNIGTTFDGEWDYIGYYETSFKFRLPMPSGKLPGHYRFGVLYDSRPTTDDEGFYLSFDQQVHAEKEERGQGLGVFCRYGWRPGDFDRVKHFWSAGAQYKGLLAGRGEDEIGVGVYSAIAASAALDRETGYEIYYMSQITPALTLTPGLQYIYQPGADAANDNVLLFALRVRMTF